MAWTAKYIEVNTPSLTSANVTVMLIDDGVDYAPLTIGVALDELTGMTNPQKAAHVDGLVVAAATDYIKTKNLAADLELLIDRVITPTS